VCPPASALQIPASSDVAWPRTDQSHLARDRKKNEALAAKIFRKDRRSSTPQQKSPSLGGSLAGRVGVNKVCRLSAPPSTRFDAEPEPDNSPPFKRVASTGPRGAPTAPKAAYRGNIDGDWTHDLHERHSAPSTPRPTAPAAAATNSLASRITNPNAGPASRVRTNPRRTAQVAQALIRTELSPASAAPRGPAAATQRINNNSSSPWTNNSNRNGGLTIRGLAGPFVVMAQNFAPGTTAADIESAVTPVGGLVQSCRLLKTEPIVIAEIVFESKDGADRVIEMFDNQTVSCSS
jgi:hypothetical protein